IQLKYNKDNNITPKTIEKNIKNILEDFGIENKREKTLEIEMVGGDIKEIIKEKKEKMKEAAEKLEFELALILREEISILEKKYGRENNNKRSKRA
ncbi:MAG TPA: UvrB/UvrC motif-containing protein, partial [Candidatus Pacearchaeota archaeon]|nr:UvrB/UvrC motif-containing protein [Candidatus Pacearchaeota archaeon]